MRFLSHGLPCVVEQNNAKKWNENMKETTLLMSSLAYRARGSFVQYLIPAMSRKYNEQMAASGFAGDDVYFL
jgi:hypothetical protein